MNISVRINKKQRNVAYRRIQNINDVKSIDRTDMKTTLYSNENIRIALYSSKSQKVRTTG